MVASAAIAHSPTNPWNPDPEVEVRWGSDSRDEMMEGWFDFRRVLKEKVDPNDLVLKPDEFDHIKPPMDSDEE